jgi:hypothetical protein
MGARSAAWMLERTLAMTPGEMALRAARGLRHRIERPPRPRPQSEVLTLEDAVDPRALTAVDERAIARLLDETRWTLLPGARDRLELCALLERIGVRPAKTIATAEAILSGTIPAFGWTTFEVGASPDWHADPVSGRRWPLVYWADLDFRGAVGLGEPRAVWELNRHHHLVTLARAYALTGDERFARPVWQSVRSWIDGNPPFFGMNWASPLEIALRLISWAAAVDLLGGAAAGEGDVRALVASAALQARHVSDNLSFYASSRNNHLIGEVAGLLTVGAKLPFLRGADRWIQVGRGLLERELGAQVAADGVSLEQAFHYQAFVLELGLLGSRALSCAGRPLPASSLAVLDRMSSFLVSVAGPGGVPPSVGDEDGGRVLELSDSGGTRFASRAAACGALASGSPFPGTLEDGDVEPLVWLFGPAVTRAWLSDGGRGRSSDSADAPRSSFPEGGYFVAGGDGHHGVIDCGPLGLGSLAAHGHADCLSIAIAHGGRWMVVDPGTCCYHRDRVWRDHFRGTSAHNTVTVDGADQSEILGPFMWGRKARADATGWARAPHFDFFEGSHDGYRGKGIVHRRAVVFGKRGYWLIVDRLDGRGRHDVRATFQLAQGLVPSDASTFVDDAGRGVGVLSLLAPGFSTEVLEGSESPRGGFVSPGFGVRRPAPAVVARGTVELPAVIVFAVVPFSGERSIDIAALSEGSAEGVRVRAAFPEGEDVCLFGPSCRLGAEHFSGSFGFAAWRGGTRQSFGIGVRSWTEGGAPVGHTALPGGVPAGT